MLNIIQLLAGPRFCPWCAFRGPSIGDRITDRLPRPVISVLLRYDALVGRIGIPLHRWLHEARRGPGSGNDVAWTLLAVLILTVTLSPLWLAAGVQA